MGRLGAGGQQAVRLVLDTHALIWFAEGNERLSAPARAAIEDPANTVFASAVSALETSTKYRLGKLPGAQLLAHEFSAVIAQCGFEGLPISVEAARLSGSFRHPLRDPFDRLLIAQALSEDLTLISNELVFEDFGVKRLW